MVSAIISRLVILVFGTLYPAYSSYKAVKARNGRDYVKWMMYWIVFALFTAAETFADVFVSWLPFYYEIKILFVIWLLSPATKGSSFIYRKFVHPQLMKREKDIDEYINRVTDQGCSALLTIGSRGLNLCAATVVQTALKGQNAVVDHLKRSYSLSDLSDPNARQASDVSDDDENADETDYYGPRRQQLGYTRGDREASTRSHRHSTGSSRHRADLSRVTEHEDEEESVEPVEPVVRKRGSASQRETSKRTPSSVSGGSSTAGSTRAAAAATASSPAGGASAPVTAAAPVATAATTTTSVPVTATQPVASSAVPGGTQFRWMTRLNYFKDSEKKDPKPNQRSTSPEQVFSRTRSRTTRKN